MVYRSQRPNPRSTPISPTMAQIEDDISMANAPETSEDASVSHIISNKRKLPKVKRHEITSRTIKRPPFSYVCLELISDRTAKILLDDLSVHSYLTTAFTQFLGLTGSAISVDILKVVDRECWIRVPREELSAVVAALGGWVGDIEGNKKVSWIVRSSGNWLGSLVRERGIVRVWKSC